MTDSHDPRVGRGLAGVSRWERGLEWVSWWAPFVTLGVGVALFAAGPASAGERAVALGLVAAAVVWTIRTYPEAARHREPRLVVRYLGGFFVLAVALVAADWAFFFYFVTGFFHAHLARTTSGVFGVVGLSSVLINLGIVLGDDPTPMAWGIYGAVVTVQTLAIGFGVLGGEKLGELTEERRVALAELEAVVEENAGLHAQLVSQARESGVLDERQRMARELHDTLAQGLVGVITQLEAARQARDRPTDLDRHLDLASTLARESLDEARRSLRDVSPGALEGSRLPEAIEAVAARWSERTGVPVEAATTGLVVVLPRDREVALLRVAQEGLANVARHAAAGRARVTLSFMGDQVALDVRDDGQGFEPTTDGDGFGLRAMRQRVEALGGSLAVESGAGQGTAICATVPVGAPRG